MSSQEAAAAGGGVCERIHSLFAPRPIRSLNRSLANSLPGTFIPRSELARELSLPGTFALKEYSLPGTFTRSNFRSVSPWHYLWHSVIF